MKAVILAGGFGTRLSEETHLRPKPMVEIGGKPILWHIMKIYSSYGINEFIVCLGYKGYIIKEYFANYFLHMSDVSFNLRENKMFVHQNYCEPWKITLIDTGLNTMTGGRLKRIMPYLDDEDFCFTYGDGVSDIRVDELIRFHHEKKALATMTTVQPPSRFGTVEIHDQFVSHFSEKVKGDGGWINGGFFVLNPGVMDYIANDQTVWEQEPLKNLTQNRQLAAFRHDGFWQAMDTLSDKNKLEQLWKSGKAPWKKWQDDL
ncbi:MAG: glucose-1-phosphate cytidylyltransferase [Desulfobacteraceae bacterium]|nr:MAG: glucose-1-phosphate cytidylyltransferase [Desulfobacteraceae bacterium]